jgi:hypothetical protein
MNDRAVEQPRALQNASENQKRGCSFGSRGKQNNRIVSVIFRGVKFTLLATALPGSCLGFKHAVGVAPSRRVTLYPTPDTCTIAATTVTLISAATVCAATTTSLAPGTQTVGAVTLLFPVPPPSPCHMPVSGRNREPSPVRSIRPRFSVRPPAHTQLVQPHSYRINDLSTRSLPPTPQAPTLVLGL